MMQAEVNLVLTLGVLLLGAGALSMLVVRLTSPGLRGVARFSAGFAAGALGAGFQLLHEWPLFNVLLTDLALLASFVLMHLAFLQLAESRMARLWHGMILFGVQTAVDCLRMTGLVGHRTRVVTLGLLITVQAITTAATLRPALRSKVRAPAGYCIVLLLGFSAMNLLRSIVLLTPVAGSAWNQRLSFLTFGLFLVVALGLAFGFLWMTTATLNAQIEHLASTDPLTRVLNRRVFLKWCEKELLRSQRSGVPFSLLMLDLDRFKCINDNFGHQRGDEVLCSAVERMQDSVRGIDVLCRWGGEEFAVLLPNASADATLIVAERIRDNIFRMEVSLGAAKQSVLSEDRLTVSIGAATFRDLDDDVAAMLLRADRALYLAKHQGRNQVLAGA